MATIEDYRKMLPCNKHRLDDELELQPDIMARISAEMTRANGRMLEAKNELAKLEARLGLEYREDDGKATKDVIEGKVVRDRERIKQWEAFQRTRTEYEDWVGMLEAWRQKGFSLKTLAELYVAQYFSRDSITVKGREQRDRDDEERRAAMRRAHGKVFAEAEPEEEESRPRRRRVDE